MSDFHFHGNRIKIASGGQKQTENTSLDLVRSLLEVIYIDRVLWEDLHNLMGQSFGCQKPKEDSVVNDHVQKYTLSSKSIFNVFNQKQRHNI